MSEQLNRNAVSAVLAGMSDLMPRIEAIYKDVHAHPELSMQERRTAGIAAEMLEKAAYEVKKGVGKTGVVGLLRNSDGPTLMLRADMDALPIAEADVLLAEIPQILRSDLYAVAALAGAAVVVIGHMLEVPYGASALAGAGLCFFLRFMAIRHGWHLPSARLSAQRRAKSTSSNDERTHR